MNSSFLIDAWNMYEDRPNLRISVIVVLALILLIFLRFFFLTIGWMFGSSELERYVVSGQVTVVGKPLNNGTIMFFPMSEKRTASVARISDSGNFKTTVQSGDYKIVLDSKITTYRKYPDIEQISGENKGLAEIDFLVPREYLDAKTTPLRMTIDSNTESETIDIPSQNKTTLLRQSLAKLKEDKSNTNEKKLFILKETRKLGPYSVKQVQSFIRAQKFTINDEVGISEDGPYLPVLRSPLAL